MSQPSGAATQIEERLQNALKQDQDHRFRTTFLQQYQERIEEILNAIDPLSYYSLHVDTTILKNQNPRLYSCLLNNPTEELIKWNYIGVFVQLQVYRARANFLTPEACIKEHTIVRFFNNPTTETRFPTYKSHDKLVQVQGIVHSMTKKGYVEHAREFVCKKCNSEYIIQGEYAFYYTITPPNACYRNKCGGQICQKPNVAFKKYAHSYQEIYLEELGAATAKPKYLTITLEDDLVDYCNLGDDAIFVGIVKSRTRNAFPGKKELNTYTLKANSARRKESRVDSLNEEQHFAVMDEWENLLSERGEFGARDHLLESLMPDLYGIYLPKLAIALSLASCVEKEKNDKTRTQVHVLMAGEPGLAKSKLLQRAVELSTRGFFAGGYRVSRAGLTAGVTKVDGEDVYEAGILPLCDGGVCAIDEFNLMAEDDKAAIHECLEQQTVSITRAGVIATLRTRCAVIAALNPKNLKRFMSSTEDAVINFGLQPALMSRFDIIFVLRDDCNAEWDKKVVKSVMALERGDIDTSNLWSIDHLKMHFLACRDIQPFISHEASEIIVAYFRRLSKMQFIDTSRTTNRCLESLKRLVKSYARLMLKTTVSALDAVVVIRLIMENMYGMGTIVFPFDPVKKDLPLGPTRQEVVEVLRAIGLASMIDAVLIQLEKATNGGTSNGTFFLQPPRATHGKNNCDPQSVWAELIPEEREQNLYRPPSMRPHIPITSTQVTMRERKQAKRAPLPAYKEFDEMEDMINEILGEDKRDDYSVLRKQKDPDEEDALEAEVMAEILGIAPPPKSSTKSSTIDPLEEEVMAEILGYAPQQQPIPSCSPHTTDPVEDEIMAEILGQNPQPKSPQFVTPPPKRPKLAPSTSGSSDSTEGKSSLKEKGSLTNSLKKLHERFAFSQVQRRRSMEPEAVDVENLPMTSMNHSPRNQPSSVNNQTPSSHGKNPRTKKSPTVIPGTSKSPRARISPGSRPKKGQKNVITLPSDGLDSMDIDNILLSVSNVFQHDDEMPSSSHVSQQQETVVPVVSQPKSFKEAILSDPNLSELVDPSLFDDSD